MSEVLHGLVGQLARLGLNYGFLFEPTPAANCSRAR